MKKLDNFETALNSLIKYSEVDFTIDSEIKRELLLSGYLNHFEKTFELSWKLGKQVMEYEGISEAETGSPLQIIRLEKQYGIIEDENIWKEALSDRNELTHRYDSTMLNDLSDKIRNKYVGMFLDFSTEIKNRIKNLYFDNLLPKSEIDNSINELCSSDILDLTHSNNLHK